MIRLAYWIVLSLLATLAIAWLISLPGTLTLEFMGLRMQPRLGVAAFLVIGFIRANSSASQIEQSIKMQAGHMWSLNQDVDHVRQMRDALGDEFDIMIDINMGWTADTAIRMGRRFEEYGVYWMEEPLHRGDYEGMRLLREHTGIRIAGAEMTRELHELREVITRGCLDVLQPDAAVTGGITGLRRIAQQAIDRGLEFTPHTWGNGIGLLANAHLAAGCGGAYECGRRQRTVRRCGMEVQIDAQVYGSRYR